MAELFKPAAYDSLAKSRSKLSVHKFGGSSLATPARVRAVGEIIRTYSSADDVIVVSANGEVTNWLQAYCHGDKQAVNKIENFLCALADSLLTDSRSVIDDFNRDLSYLKHQELSDEARLAFGEVWSARLLNAYLQESGIKALFIDARQLLTTDSIDNYQRFDVSYFKCGFERQVYGNFGCRLIVTGYIATDLLSDTITLGRNGSDYSAALLAYFCNAKKVTLWTDVAGIYTADPRIVSSARAIEYLTYQEAAALASIGTNVLHRKTIEPLAVASIPLFVRSSLEPEKTPTQIGPAKAGVVSKRVTSIAIKNNQCLVNFPKISEIEFKRLQRQLFEGHIGAVERLSRERNLAPCLYISDNDIADAELIFESNTLDWQLAEATVSLIAIVCSQVSATEVVRSISQQIALSNTQHFTDEKYNTLFLETTTENPLALLNQLYTELYQPPSDPSIVKASVSVSEADRVSAKSHCESLG